MQAIGFNEHYGLQTAVFERRKTKTRRLELLSLLEGLTEDDFWFGIVDGKKQVQLYDDNPGPEIIMPRYNIGEVVAVRQCYRDIIDQLEDRMREYVIGYYSGSKAWTNKMFIRPDLMPRHIQITDVDLQRLQSISDEDCLNEGVHYYNCGIDYGYTFNRARQKFGTASKAFAALINRISGKGTWERNPWVFAYSFELID
jgi:hypothetical protein